MRRMGRRSRLITASLQGATRRLAKSAYAGLLLAGVENKFGKTLRDDSNSDQRGHVANENQPRPLNAESCGKEAKSTLYR